MKPDDEGESLLKHLISFLIFLVSSTSSDILNRSCFLNGLDKFDPGSPDILCQCSGCMRRHVSRLLIDEHNKSDELS